MWYHESPRIRIYVPILQQGPARANKRGRKVIITVGELKRTCSVSAKLEGGGLVS